MGEEEAGAGVSAGPGVGHWRVPWRGWRPLGECAGGGSASALTSSSPGGRRAGSGGGWGCTGASSPQRHGALQAGLAPPRQPLAPLHVQGSDGGPTGDGDMLAVQWGRWQWPAAPRSLAAGRAGAPSEASAGRGSWAVRCAGGPARDLKITRCECPAGLGPRTIGGNVPASSIVWPQTLASSVLPRERCSRRHKGAAARERGLPSTRRGAGGCPPAAPPVPRRVQPPRGPGSARWSGEGAVRCNPPVSWPCPAHAAFPAPALAPVLPTSGVWQQCGMGRGVRAACGAARPSCWQLPGSPCPAHACACPHAGMSPRRVPAAEPQRPAQPV